MQVFLERDMQIERLDMGDTFKIEMVRLIELRKKEFASQVEQTKFHKEKGERMQALLQIKEDWKAELMKKK
jgi:hypothetical protein